MTETKSNPPVGGMVILLLVLINAIVLKSAFLSNGNGWLSLLVSFPLLLMAIISMIRDNKTA